MKISLAALLALSEEKDDNEDAEAVEVDADETGGDPAADDSDESDGDEATDEEDAGDESEGDTESAGEEEQPADSEADKPAEVKTKPTGDQNDPKPADDSTTAKPAEEQPKETGDKPEKAKPASTPAAVPKIATFVVADKVTQARKELVKLLNDFSGGQLYTTSQIPNMSFQRNKDKGSVTLYLNNEEVFTIAEDNLGNETFPNIDALLSALRRYGLTPKVSYGR